MRVPFLLTALFPALALAQSSSQNIPIIVAPYATVAVNGSSTGTQATAGAQLSVSFTVDGGHPTDWIGICNAGVDPAADQCDGAGYAWSYLNCSQSAPATNVPSGTCALPAPAAAGNFTANVFQGVDPATGQPVDPGTRAAAAQKPT